MGRAARRLRRCALISTSCSQRPACPLPTTPIECNSLIAARALLLESDRIMLLSAHQIHYELKAGLLVALPHPAGNVVRPIGLHNDTTGIRPTRSERSSRCCGTMRSPPFPLGCRGGEYRCGCEPNSRVPTSVECFEGNRGAVTRREIQCEPVG